VPANEPSDLGYGSSPGSFISLPSSSNALHPPDLVPEPSDSDSEAPESKEERERRKNRKSCKKSREKKKKKVEEEQRELKHLEDRNRELKATVQGMEEFVAWHKSLLKDASRKRRAQGGDNDQGEKKKRQ